MNNQPEARIKNRISSGELERRWKAVRQSMKEESLDFLVMQSYTDVLGGFVKWFTDLAALNNYPSTVIFPREEEMTTIWHGPSLPAQPSPPEWAVRGVKKRISVPVIPSLDYTNAYIAEKIVKELQPYNKCRIGLVGMGFISAAVYQYITKHLPDAEFVEATDLVDNIKAVKSDEEIEGIRSTCALQDTVFNYLLKHIQPGKTESEIYNDVKRKCIELGADQTNIMGGSAQPGQAVRMMLACFGNKVIEDGDQFTILIESNGPSGFWAEMMGTICLGKVTSELEEHFETSRTAQKKTLEMLKPGTDPKAIFAANSEFLVSRGFPPELRVYAHGMGYDMVERPAIAPDETLLIKSRMNLAVHPAVMSEKAFGTVCENYVILDSGDILCLHKTPQKIFKL